MLMKTREIKIVGRIRPPTLVPRGERSPIWVSTAQMGGKYTVGSRIWNSTSFQPILVNKTVLERGFKALPSPVVRLGLPRRNNGLEADLGSPFP